MNAAPERPEPFPVEILDGCYRVRIDSASREWLECDSAEDARLIAEFEPMKFDALEFKRSGEGFAQQLERLANVLQKYNMGVGARFMRTRAEEARERGNDSW